MDIINSIKSRFSDKPQLIYLGIGTYAGLTEADGSLADKNYHQYPPFIQHLKNSVQDLQLSIVLIDPCQEDPPYMVQHMQVNELTLNNNIYSSADQSLTVYTLREHVYTDSYNKYNDNYINITSLLRDLNEYVMTNDIALIYHDFTGRENRLLAEYFDDDLSNHLDHIIYGLGLREDVGCYIDLTSPCSYQPFYLNRENKLRFFNVYNNKNNNNKNNNTKYDANMICDHNNKIINIIKSEIANVALQKLRVVFRLVTEVRLVTEEEVTIDFDFLSGAKRETCLALIRDKNYCDLYNFLLDYYGKKLDIVAAIKGLDITGREILECITLGDEPFQWYNNVKHFL